MSEPMFPAPDGAGAAPAGGPVAESGSGNRTMLMVLGGVGAALVVGAGAYFLLNSGGSAPDTTASPGQSVTGTAPAAVPAAKPATKPVVIRPATVSVSSRDPFKPLISVATVGTTSGAAGSPTTPSTAPVPVAPVTPVTPVTPTVTLSVSKIDPTLQTATVTVDGKAYATRVGVVFAKTFQLYSVFNAQCVGILFGDQSVPVCISRPQTVSP